MLVYSSIIILDIIIISLGKCSYCVSVTYYLSQQKQLNQTISILRKISDCMSNMVLEPDNVNKK